ncbi:PH domain-containing protein [Caenorhabditis elegans]|uniref:Uncharacterized protein C15H7.4 n=1 Tax=Caenorhabditis elegans TaxID=6239 RepID=YK14_CAEEL|nr:Uncharacterized protein CELE_C15H7.4 [Caenorhabditis elegans]P34338.1 RecName: Full=Uncharacterized protein C15H7.4 [Caenorhabditis elegans]CAA80126.1 Uncharacterized protein CELE_C15H7.4 [Caenorhabditis elegans]|eukprot:NP_499136.1 Uncharacterized protein CELE_C15H7.4 [Caenorhabditis elegans]
MCSVKPKYISLPEQNSLCSLPNSGCCQVEVKIGRSKWEQQKAILVKVDGEPAGKIFIYSQPLIGQMYPLHELKSMGVICEKAGDFLVNLVTERGLKLTFKPIGSTANCFVTALVSGNFTSLTHETHIKTPLQNQEATTSPTIESDLTDKPDTNVYTGSREGYVAPSEKGSNEKKKEVVPNGGDKSVENKKGSDRNVKKTPSKTVTKPLLSESRKRKEAKTLATTQSQDLPAPTKDEPERTNSEPDNGEQEKIKKEKKKGTETSLKDGKNKLNEKIVKPAPTTTPDAGNGGLTPGKEDNKKTVTTSSVEIEVPEKKKAVENAGIIKIS